MCARTVSGSVRAAGANPNPNPNPNPKHRLGKREGFRDGLADLDGRRRIAHTEAHAVLDPLPIRRQAT